MLFNSLEFFLFFPLVTIGYFALPHRFRWVWLLGASCMFYMSFVPIYILILAGTIVIDYIAGIWIEKSEGAKRKRLLALSIVCNVGILAFFKYYNFLNDNLTALLGIVNWTNHIPALKILLPIGLSFHTFQAMSYTIEVYRGNQKAERHFGLYALYVMFYPQLVAGPIERPQNIIHQFKVPHKFDYRNAIVGSQMMLWGLFKKVVIADRLGLYVSQVFEHPGSYHGFQVITAACFFVIQVYCDFSGYSNIAIGSAKVMGFDLVTNFNLPLSSKSITEFWRRWHISLTTWFNDYLYTPFVVKRREWGIWAVVIGLLITFLVSGLWHGAAWTFVVFGLLHGLAVIFEMFTKKARKKIGLALPPKLHSVGANILTFSFLAFSLVFFRAGSFHDALIIFRNMIPHRISFTSLVQPFAYGNAFYNKTEFITLFGALGILWFVQYFERKNTLAELAGKLNVFTRWSVYYGLAMLIILFGSYSDRMQFIYFQF